MPLLLPIQENHLYLVTIQMRQMEEDPAVVPVILVVHRILMLRQDIQRSTLRSLL